MSGTGFFPRFLPHLWPLPSNYFLLPWNVSLSPQEGGGKTMRLQKPPGCIEKNSRKSGLPPALGCVNAKSSRSEVRKVKSRQESINSTCGEAPAFVLQRVNANTCVHAHTHTTGCSQPWLLFLSIRLQPLRKSKETRQGSSSSSTSLTVTFLYDQRAARASQKCRGETWVSLLDYRCG